MSSINISTGLISGLDFDSLINAYSLNQQRAIDRLNARNQEFEIKTTGINALEANLLSLNSTVQTLSNDVTFEQFSVSNSQPEQVQISAAKSAEIGKYSFQSLQLASTQQSLSRGFADADTQTVGEGTLTIADGGFVDQSTLLESLNDGAGIRRGSIRISDRSGSSAVVDLSRVLSVDDVLEQINNSSEISVTARVVDGQFVLEDTSGSTAASLTVQDLNGGNAAADLGIEKSVASSTLSGDQVYRVSENFVLDQLNDGNGLRLLNGAADIQISTADGTELQINLDGSRSLKDVLTKINDSSDNAGKVDAELTDGRIVLTDNTTGGGTLSVIDINDSAVVKQLGLDATASGSTLTGNRLSGGMNSVLLRNLRGGQGISQLGEVSFTDRTGQTATLDFTGAETLTDIIETINSATDDLLGDSMFVKASLNSTGDGIVVVDTSGATDSNFVIADLAGSTLAAELNLELDDAVTEVDSDSLAMRYINEATTLSDYAPGGEAVENGLFQITDTDGNVGVISITTAAENIGDVIQRINANSSISVRAELNETGDGFVLIDEAGGSGTLEVSEFGDTTTAADLRLLGESVTGVDGFQRVSSRRVTQVEVEADDTLDDVVTKLNRAGSLVSASTFNDGTTFNSTRLSLTSKQSGAGGRLLFDDGGLGLNFGTISEAQDAILQVGANTETAFLLRSDDDQFDDVVKGIDVDLKSVGNFAATVEIAANTESVFENVQRLVSSYNQFVELGDELTKFNGETSERGILQGDGIVLRATSRISAEITGRVGDANATFSSLASLGVRIGEGGKLIVDDDRLRDALSDDLNGVKEFFTADTVGFAAQLDVALKSLTDVVDGAFTLEKNSYATSIDRNNERVEDLGLILENRKTRLLNQFVKMENTISSLQSQQTALGALQPISSGGGQ